MAHAFVDSSLAQGALRAVMVVLPLGNAGVEDDRIHQAVGRIHFGSHHAIKVVKEQAIQVGPQFPLPDGRL